MVRVQLLIMAKRIPTSSFHDTMRGFMEKDRSPQKIDQATKTHDQRPCFPTNVLEEIRGILHKEMMMLWAFHLCDKYHQAIHRVMLDSQDLKDRPRDNHDRLLPRGRASADRPVIYQYPPQRPEYRIPEFLFNHLKPYFQSFLVDMVNGLHSCSSFK